ncbi:MAG: cytidine deaminase [SAR324 cluster bacterium]|uniref:Cytidine deaminase n=1 Tax=SAR324 cluster bacterium TaxID=2024889 RepID=A0A2A4SSG4_9DELT|nr:MAG: cytidine deaminase [SAR324 cluster bacterium]
MLREMIEKAATAMQQAYAPYSGFHVGAVIKSKGGALFVGCNVENAAYPEGVCAEAGAISAMILAGDREIEEIVVMGAGKSLVTPCGGCRQKIREFAGDDIKIHICDPQGLRKTVTLKELLPLSFGPENLR